MKELIWLNGEVMPMAEARVSVEDRGFQFADGVYEVIRLYDGKPFALDEHLDRLEKSASAILIELPLSLAGLRTEICQLIEKTEVGEGMIYLQLTRGPAARNHLYPSNARPTLLFYARPLEKLPAVEQTPGVKLISVADERWKRCWIKSIALLANVLAKNQAVAAVADEAVFIDEGVVTECSASNFFAVIGGRLVTHPVGAKVLPGVTAKVLLECAGELGIPVEQRPLKVEEAHRAQELFITSTTREISWVREWEGYQAEGVGAVTRALHEALRGRVGAAYRRAS